MKCQSCQEVLADDAQFCGSCGLPTASPPSNAATRIHRDGVGPGQAARGTYGPLGYATKLVINNHNGDRLDGTLEQGALRVAFNGTYNPETGALTMKQTKVLSGEGWSLGEDTGTLSTDSKMMSGIGQDPLGGALGFSYQWSFTGE